MKTPESKSKKQKKKKKKVTGVVNSVMIMSNICRNKFGSCTEEKLKEKKCEKNRFQQLGFFRKEFFRGSLILRMFLSVRFNCQRTWLGCMMGWRI